MNPIIDSNAEWLEADGMGGFASGTVSGIRTRRYHALLLTATTPPSGRMALVNGFDAWVETAGGTFPISSQRYAPDVIHPNGASFIESFEREPWPRWRYRLTDDLVVEQELYVPNGESAVLWNQAAAAALFQQIKSDHWSKHRHRHRHHHGRSRNAQHSVWQAKPKTAAQAACH